MENDDLLAPMVDALTGALISIILISMFLLVSTKVISDNIKDKEDMINFMVSKYTLSDADVDPLNRVAPYLDIKEKKIMFFNGFLLDKEQVKLILESVNLSNFNITIYSKEGDPEMDLYNVLFFITSLGVDYKDVNKIAFKHSDNDTTSIHWN